MELKKEMQNWLDSNEVKSKIEDVPFVNECLGRYFRSGWTVEQRIGAEVQRKLNQILKDSAGSTGKSLHK